MGAEGTIIAETDIDIMNAALIQMGQSPISAFGQNVGSAIVSQAYYNRSRDALLRLQPWNFARKWQALNLLQNAPLNLDIIPSATGPGVIQFTGAFKLPDDNLRVFRFSPKDAHWRVVGNAIYTDAIPPTLVGTPLGLQPLGSDGTDNQPTMSSAGAPVQLGIEYISQVTDPQQWDALFIDCFTWKICKELAFGITGLMQWYKFAANEYEDHLKDAAVVNGIENWPDPFWCTELNDVRYGYAGVSIEGF